MKITLYSILILISMALVFLPNGFAQNHPQWGLPEGAIARIAKGNINDVKFSPDGTQLAVATYTGVWIHDPNTGAELEILPGRDVNSIAYSPDGQLLASAERNRVQLWNAVSGQRITTLANGGSGVAFSPDGRTLASGAGWHSNKVHLWDVNSRELKTTLSAGGASVAFSPDGKRLASTGRWNSRIFIWDLDTGELTATSTGHSCLSQSLAFSPDSQTLASAGGDHKVRLWNATTAQSIGVLEGYGNVVAYSPDGKMLASQHHVWDAVTLESKVRLIGYGFSKVAFSPDSQTLAGGNLLLDVNTGQPKITLSGYGRHYPNVVFSPDGQTLASDSIGVQLWDTTSGQYKRNLAEFGGNVSFSPDGQTLANSGGWPIGRINLWDVASGENRATFVGHTSGVMSIAFSPDGQTLASGSADQTARLWDVNTGKPKATLTGHTGWVNSVSFSPDGQTLASGSDDKTVRLWDVNTGELKATLTGHTDDVMNVAFSPDGQLLAGAGWRSPVHVWDVNTGKRRNIPGLHDGVFSVAFSPNGNILAFGDSQFNIRLLDVATGRTLETIVGHGSKVWNIAFSPDGQTLASGGFGGTVFLWDLKHFIKYTPLGNIDSQQTQNDTSIEQYEREMVRLIYFRPSDRPYREGINTELDTLIRWSQYFYAKQMENYGDQKTFAFETDDTGHAKVHHVIGKFTDTYYHQDTYSKVVEEVADQFDTSRDVFLIAIDVSSEFINNAGTCGIGGGGWKSFDNELWRRNYGGTAVIPASGVCINPSIAAHELGHVFGLDHDFRDDTYLMAYGTQERLSQCAAEWLDAHRFFNNDPTFLNDETTMEILSSRTSGSNTRHLRFELTDTDGLHQAQLIVPAAATDPAPGTKLHGCKSMSGENQAVEFTVTGLKATPEVEVTLQVIDIYGNITKQAFPVLAENQVSNRAPTVVRTIPTQALTFGSNATTLNMSLYFTDPNSDDLRYTAESDNTSVVIVSLSGSQMIITPRRTGNAIVTVTASDGELRVAQRFSVHIQGTSIIGTAATFDDPFEGTALQNPNWEWQNEPTNWNVGETREGFLHIKSETNRNLWVSDTTHFLYQETDADAFDVETHFFARWDTSSGVNGLVVKSPADNNWVTLKFRSQNAAAKGQIQYQTKGRESGNGLTGNAGFTPTYGNTELFFRLRKQGDTYTGWYKTREADPWIEIGVTNFPLTPPLQLGIYAGVAAGTGTLTVNYEYFRSTVDTGVLASPTLQFAAMVVPTETTLLPNYPNPFNPETWIPYQLASPANVTVYIYAVNGSLVRRLSLGHQATGMYHNRSRAVYWDGKNKLGEPVASGVYFYTLTAGDFTATRKMLIRK